MLPNIWKLASGGLLFVCLMLGLKLAIETRHGNKVEGQLAKATAELQRISTAKNEQKTETGKNIAQANERIVYVDRYIAKLETRPLPGNCQTPDLNEWREVL
jgi:poly(3-hydroxyalkanoate) synthetase